MLACTPDPLPDLLADIEELVCCESLSADLTAVARSADVVARVGERRLGAAPERIVLDGRTHLRWRLGAAPSRVLLFGHHDTVWPLGSLAIHPYTVDCRGAAWAGLLRHEGRAGAGHARRRGALRDHAARHRRRAARLT